MSIGNLKDSGNQGNNFPFQKAVLKGLALSQCRNLTEVYLTSTLASVATTINAYFTANPDKYLVSKIVVHDSPNFRIFLTVADL